MQVRHKYILHIFRIIMVCVCVCHGKHIYFEYKQCFFLLLSKKNLFKLLPQNRKQNSLHTIRQNFGLQSTEHQSLNSTLLNDILDDLGIRYSIGVALFVHLDDTDGVGACVRDGRGAKAKDGPSTQLAHLRILLWYFLREEVVSEEPGIVPHKGGRSSSKGAMVEHQRSATLDLVHHIGELASDLHGSLDGVNGHEEDAEGGSSDTGGDGL
mmetsp:Transcript_40957/g.59850  ORF Transcript_40957/g.59850 Transcript_40957/m.59850 type:complete len:211 (-) Transcript_40957:535-1167(-)